MLFSLEKRQLRRDLIALQLPKRRLQRVGCQSLFSGYIDRTQGSGLKFGQGSFRFGFQEKFLPVEGGKALEQAAQRSVGVPIPGGI